MTDAGPDLQNRPGPGRFLFEPPDLRSRRKLDARLPDLLVPSFLDVPFEALAARGVVNYCLDLDNTLALQTSYEPAPGVLDTLRAARAAGYVQGVCLISNTIWGQRRVDRLAHMAKLLDIELFYAARLHDRKPFSASYRWALKMLGVEARHTATVGDQIFSDIVGGNRMGLFTILVPQLGPDHWTTAIIGRRRRERIVLNHYGLSFERKS